MCFTDYEMPVYLSERSKGGIRVIYYHAIENRKQCDTIETSVSEEEKKEFF